MEIQFLPSDNIEQLLSLQKSVDVYYDSIICITTEDTFIKIFSRIRKHHMVFREKLIRAIYKNVDADAIQINKGQSLMERMWDEVLVAVLVNNEFKIIEYCRQNEIKLLQYLRKVIFVGEYSVRVQQILEEYALGIQQYLKSLNQLQEAIVKSKAA
ncbi:MAG: hypothetical protein AAF573_00345 [Bacteroidota bacterium]